MVYIALLRGINVGGKTLVSMAELKTCFENMGFTQVKTYINSGNVLFAGPETDRQPLTKKVERAISKYTSLDIRVLIKTKLEITAIAQKVPAHIKNDTETKSDVLFLWPEVDTADTLTQIPINPVVETNEYYPGAIIHLVQRDQVTKSRLTRIVGTDLYKSISIRNINTVRKLVSLADAITE